MSYTPSPSLVFILRQLVLLSCSGWPQICILLPQPPRVCIPMPGLKLVLKQQRCLLWVPGGSSWEGRCLFAQQTSWQPLWGSWCPQCYESGAQEAAPMASGWGRLLTCPLSVCGGGSRREKLLEPPGHLLLSWELWERPGWFGAGDKFERGQSRKHQFRPRTARPWAPGGTTCPACAGTGLGQHRPVSAAGEGLVPGAPSPAGSHSLHPHHVPPGAGAAHPASLPQSGARMPVLTVHFLCAE